MKHIRCWSDVHLASHGTERTSLIGPLTVAPIAIKDVRVVETIKVGRTTREAQ